MTCVTVTGRSIFSDGMIRMGSRVAQNDRMNLAMKMDSTEGIKNK
jgi:hypothetical protein